MFNLKKCWRICEISFDEKGFVQIWINRSNKICIRKKYWTLLFLKQNLSHKAFGASKFYPKQNLVQKILVQKRSPEKNVSRTNVAWANVWRGTLSLPPPPRLEKPKFVCTLPHTHRFKCSSSFGSSWNLNQVQLGSQVGDRSTLTDKPGLLGSRVKCSSDQGSKHEIEKD